MAVIPFTRSEPSASKAKIVTWSAIANGDTADPFLPVEGLPPRHPDRRWLCPGGL